MCFGRFCGVSRLGFRLSFHGRETRFLISCCECCDRSEGEAGRNQHKNQEQRHNLLACFHVLSSLLNWGAKSLLMGDSTSRGFRGFIFRSGLCFSAVSAIPFLPGGDIHDPFIHTSAAAMLEQGFFRREGFGVGVPQSQ